MSATIIILFDCIDYLLLVSPMDTVPRVINQVKGK